MARKGRSPGMYFTMPPGELREHWWNDEVKARLARLGWQARLNPHEGRLSDEQWAEELAGVEALVTMWGAPRLTDAVLARNDTLRIVGHAAGSVGGIVCEDLYRRGVKVTTANVEMARSVAEWSLMMTLVGWGRLLEEARFGLSGGAVRKVPSTHPGPHRAVIGLWGYGDIAACLLRLLRPFEPKEILVCSGHLSAKAAAAKGMRKVEFDELLAAADVIHVLTGLTEKNFGRVGAKELASIKDNAVLINAGRADLIQHDALAAELSRGRFYAILDVHHTEPVPPDSPFRNLPNVILTPHIAGRGRYDKYVPCILDEFERFYAGKRLRHEIAPDRAGTMTKEALRSQKT